MGNINTTFFDSLDAAATWSAGVAFKRSKGLPLDKYSVFETKTLAEEYAEKRGAYAETPVSYPGQVIAVAEGAKMVAYVLAESTDGSKLELQQIGIIPTGDDKTISVTEDGVISLLAADAQIDEKNEAGEATGNKVVNAGAQLILQSDGTIKWVQPDTSTAEGQAAAISALQGRMTTAEGDIDDLEAKVGEAGTGQTGTLYELIAEESERAIRAEGNLTDWVTNNFVKGTELTTTLEPYAKTADVNTELAKKVDATTYKTDKEALEKADSDLDTAVKAAKKAAEDAQATIDNFLIGEGVADVIDTLKDIQDELEALTDATELADALASKADKTTVEGIEGRVKAIEDAPYATKADVQAVDGKFADYTTTENLTTLLAGKQDTIPANTYDTYGAAAQALADAKADTDTKLSSYYTKDEIAGLNHATKTEVENAVKAEADIARAAEKANADAITAIKDHATIDSFADVVAELDKKQATGDYATKTEAQGYANAKDQAISEAKAQADKGVADAKAAKDAADAAQADADTNTINIQEIEKEINGYTIGEGEEAQQVDGLITKVASNTSRIGALEGTVSEHGTAISGINSTLGTKANQSDLDTANQNITKNTTAIGVINETTIPGLQNQIDTKANQAALETVIVDLGDTSKMNTGSGAGNLVDYVNEVYGEVDSLITDNIDNKAAISENSDKITALTNTHNTDKAALEASIEALAGENGRVTVAEGEIDALQETIKGLSGAMHFEGVKDEVPTDVTDYEAGDTIIVGNKEYVFDGTSFKEFGDASVNADAITKLEGKVKILEDVDHEAAHEATLDSAKDYADGLADNYATAAQGAKADTAIQSVAAGTGLKVVADENDATKLTVNIDDTIVFVFDGGSATSEW